MKKTAILIIFFTFTGFLQMFLATVFGFHDGLEHMQHRHWWGYAIESLFYSFFHYGMYNFFKNN